MAASKNITRFRHRISSPLRYFFNDSRSSGLLLLACTALSLALANIPATAGSYLHGWSAAIPFTSTAKLPPTPLAWINSFLMSFFFLLAGMEIKRAMLQGELSGFNKAILPFGAALGGMLVPALIFCFLNRHTPYVNGWGIPTATDIAFSLAAASLLGPRFPLQLKILLMALAIIDDLGAILVIAVFYGTHINGLFIALGGLVYALLLLAGYTRRTPAWVAIVLSLLLWYCMLQSGVEAAISGVLMAFALPVRVLPRMEKALHGWVHWIILPLFALANTALPLPWNVMLVFHSRPGLGILLGLVAGKPLGIFLFSRLLVGFGWAHLPAQVSWKQVAGMGVLAGIGFTMSVFITLLAFPEPAQQNIAKLAILIALLFSLLIGFGYFRLLPVPPYAGATKR